MLDEAERKTKRSLRAATLYKDEISRLNPTKAAGKKKVTAEEEHVMGLESIKKEAEIERMTKEIAELQAQMSKGKSKACLIS